MNPFRYGSTVADKDFCPRPKLENTIRKHIASCQNIHIEGDRRTGKTSLVFEVARKRKRSILLHFDFQLVKCTGDVRARFVEGLSAATAQTGMLDKLIKHLAHLRPIVSINPATGEPALSLKTEDADSLDGRTIGELLDFAQKTFTSQKPILFLDAFQDVAKLPEAADLLAAMRSRIQRHHNCTYIYSGSSRSDMDAIFRNPDSPFFKSAIAVPVDVIDRNEFIPFLAAKFHGGKRSTSTEVLAEVLDLVEDNPGDAQELCNCLWEATAPGDSISSRMIESALNLIFTREFKYFAQVLEDITALQKRCLQGLARCNGYNIYAKAFMQDTGIMNTGSITRAIKQLEKRRIISSARKRFVFASPFLKLWLLRNPHL